MKLGSALSQPRTLWLTFIAVLIITAAFPMAADIWNLSFLDAMSDPDEVRATIASMSSDQRVAHAWITATLDVLYPLAYGALFVGSAYAFYGRFGWLIALPFFVLVPVDLLEGVVQVLALNGVADWVDAKAVLTPLKTGLFLFGVLITVVGWVIWLFRRFGQRNTS